MYVYIYIYYMGKFDHERTLFSRALEIMVYVRKIIPFYGRKIQVSEILQFTHIYIYMIFPAMDFHM